MVVRYVYLDSYQAMHSSYLQVNYFFNLIVPAIDSWFERDGV